MGMFKNTLLLAQQGTHRCSKMAVLVSGWAS